MVHWPVVPREPGLRHVGCRIYRVALVDAPREHGIVGLLVVICHSIRRAASVVCVLGENH